MFECGLEGVTIKIVKKSLFEHVEDDPQPIIDNTETVDPSDKSTHTTPRLSEFKAQVLLTPKVKEKEKKPQEEANVKQEKERENKEINTATKDNGNVSSCIIEFKVVWFNFAAPPRAPITRKIDYTRFVALFNFVISGILLPSFQYHLLEFLTK